MDFKTLQKITTKPQFQTLPVSARELFFRLAIKCGDNNTIKPLTTVQACKATYNDLRVLYMAHLIIFTDADTENSAKSWEINFLTSETEIRIVCDVVPMVKKKKEEQKIIFGEYRHVKMTQVEYDKLVSSYGQSVTDEFIQKVDGYCEQKGKTYNNYYLATINFLKRDGKVARNVESESRGLHKSDSRGESNGYGFK